MTTTAPETTEPATSEPTNAPPAPSGAPMVHIILLLDRSGSMEKIRDDVIGGLNAFLTEQKAQPGSCKFTMIQFDTQGYDYVYLGADVASVGEFTRERFVPRSGTNLYDAIGRAITEADVRAGALNMPEVVLFAIFTDGEENSSTTYTRQQIFLMIEEHQAPPKSWTFTYMGANQDAYAEGAAMGISRGNTQAYVGDGLGAQNVYASFSSNTTALRSQVAGGQSVNATAFFDAAGKGAEADLLTRRPDDQAAQGVTGQTVDSTSSAE